MKLSGVLNIVLFQFLDSDFVIYYVQIMIHLVVLKSYFVFVQRLEDINSIISNSIYRSRFPLVNNLVQKINLRKRRDTIIIGTVIGLCLTFLLWYAFA